MTQAYFKIDAKRLAEARARRAYSVNELARLCAVTSERMYQIQRGGQQVRPGTLRRIAGALGIEPGELVADG